MSGESPISPALQTPPSGFCPKCHYPIDPGTCPECGSEITTDSILTSLSQIRAARRRRWILISLPMLLIIGASIGARRVSWPPHIPTALLLRLQGDAQHWATLELANRFSSGALSPKQISQLIEAAMPPPRLAVRPVISADTSAVVWFTPELRLPPIVTSRIWLELTVEGILVDGSRRDDYAGQSIFMPPQFNRSTPVRRLDLVVGEHEIAIEWKLRVMNAWGQEVFSRPASSKLAVAVKSGNAGCLITSSCAELDKKAVVASLRVVLDSSGTHHLEITTSSDKPIIAGVVHARPHGASEYNLLGTILLDESHFIQRYSLDWMNGVPSVDVRLLPDPRVALEQSPTAAHICDCTFEWLELSFQEPVPMAP